MVRNPRTIVNTEKQRKLKFSIVRRLQCNEKNSENAFSFVAIDIKDILIPARLEGWVHWIPGTLKGN